MGKVQILDRTTGLAYLTSFPIIDTLAVFTIYHTILYDIVLLDNNSQQNGDDINVGSSIGLKICTCVPCAYL